MDHISAVELIIGYFSYLYQNLRKFDKTVHYVKTSQCMICEPCTKYYNCHFWIFFFFQGIQITATTPSACAVRLETGLVDFELSNKPRYTNTGTKKKGTSKYRYIQDSIILGGREGGREGGVGSELLRREGGREEGS